MSDILEIFYFRRCMNLRPSVSKTIHDLNSIQDWEHSGLAYSFIITKKKHQKRQRICINYRDWSLLTFQSLIRISNIDLSLSIQSSMNILLFTDASFCQCPNDIKNFFLPFFSTFFIHDGFSFPLFASFLLRKMCSVKTHQHFASTLEECETTKKGKCERMISFFI